jgi:hypothetical protein
LPKVYDEKVISELRVSPKEREIEKDEEEMN